MADDEIVKFQEQMKQWREQMLASLPAHLRVLGRILRRSIKYNSLLGLRRFLRKHRIDVPMSESGLRTFRDLLIIQRIDLKDLEPQARARLRLRTLRDQDLGEATNEYRTGRAAGLDLRCRDCRYFVEAPNDGDGDDHDKSCVELGVKGVDLACAGFTTKPN